MVSKTCKEGETSLIKTRYDLYIKIRSFLIKYFHNFVIMSLKSAYPKFSNNHPEIHCLNRLEKKKRESGLDFFHKEPAPGLLVTSSLLLLKNHEQNLDLLPKRDPTRITILLPKLCQKIRRGKNPQQTTIQTNVGNCGRKKPKFHNGYCFISRSFPQRKTTK